MLKTHITITAFLLAMMASSSGCGRYTEVSSTDGSENSIDSTQVSEEIVVEASCGECQFGLPGTGCSLAVRIDGKAYFVDGSDLDDHGDAHGQDGLCNAVRMAKVVGQVNDGRFTATSFELLPHDPGQQVENRKQQLQKSRLGIALTLDGADLVIEDVWEDGVAGKSGLQAGDHIEKLNGTPAKDLEPTAIRSLIAESPTIVFSINRDSVEMEISVTAEITTEPETGTDESTDHDRTDDEK